MAEAIEVLLNGGKDAWIGPERYHVSVSVKYALVDSDGSVPGVCAVKMAEVERGITAAWNALQGEKQRTENTDTEPVPPCSDDDEEVYPDGYHSDEESGEEENGEEPQEGDDGKEGPFTAHPSPPREMNPAHPSPPVSHSSAPVSQYVPPVTQYVPPAPAELVVLVSKVQLLAIRPLLTRLNFTSDDTRDPLQKVFKKWSLERLTRDEGNDLLVSLRRGEIEAQQKRGAAAPNSMNGSYANGRRAH